MQLDDDLKDILARCYSSTKVLAKTLFPERFELKFSTLHDQIFEALDNDKYTKVVIKAPRGFGKTSIVNMAYPAKKALFREKKYIVPVSCTSTQAVLQGENLKFELLTNSVISKLFGPVKSNQFSKEQWVTEWGTCVMPRGGGQQIRGLLFGNYRPDLIIIDDLEDTEGVASEEQRGKLKEWFFADVMNSIDRGKKNWKIVFIGTLLHEDSLLANLLKDKTWYRVELDLCDDNYKSNWPEFMGDEEIAELVDSYREHGLLDVFYREYRGRAISTEDSTFMQNYFRYYEESDLRSDKAVENVVILDPAKTTNLKSADSAIVGIGVNTSIPKIYIRDVVSGRMHPDEIIDNAFAMCEQLKAVALAYEVTGLNEFISYPIKTEHTKRDCRFQLVELAARGKKADRIACLVPFYKRGYVWHNKRCCNKLEEQLLSFPRSAKWDVMDATAYIIEVLDEGDRYFESTVVRPGDVGEDLPDEDYSEVEDQESEVDYSEREVAFRII